MHSSTWPIENQRSLPELFCSTMYTYQPMLFQLSGLFPFKNYCHGFVTCARCPDFGHDNKSFENVVRCGRCQAIYATYFHFCQNWIRKKEIPSFKFTHNILYPEESKLIESRIQSFGVSCFFLLKMSSKSEIASMHPAFIFFSYHISI